MHISIYYYGVLKITMHTSCLLDAAIVAYVLHIVYDQLIRRCCYRGVCDTH